MKSLLASFLLLCCAFFAHAGPTLSADPVLETAQQPVSAEWQVQGEPTWTACAFSGTPKVMACDLARLTATVGQSMLVARYTYEAGCNAAGACWGAGTAVSTPFAFTWLGAGVLPPLQLRVAP